MTPLPPQPSVEDSELDALFASDPDLLRTARRLRRARPQTELDPRFPAVLRAQIMGEAPAVLGKRGWWQARRGTFAWTAVGLGVLTTAAAVTLIFVNQVGRDLTQVPAIAATNVAGNASVDPNQAITVGFTVPMDQASVEAALHIEPATSIHTSWNGNTLTIIPDHHLAANVPYTITIDHTTARASNGMPLTADVTVDFGTAATPVAEPSPTSSAPPTLNAVAIAPATGDVILFGPDGSIVANGSPSGLPSPTASGTTESPLTSGSPSPGQADGLYSFPSSGGSLRIADRAAAAAFAPDGGHLAYAITGSDGSSTIYIAQPDGSSAQSLATTSTAVVALGWQSNSTVTYATANAVSSVTTGHHVRTIVNATAGETFTTLSPNGRFVFESSAAAFSAPASTAGTMIDLSTSTAQILPGSGTSVNFSADGSSVAWVNTATTPATLSASPTSTLATETINLNGVDAGHITTLALSQDGTELAYVAKANDGSALLYVASRTNGEILATGDGSATQLAFDSSASHLGYLTTNQTPTVEVAPLPATNPAPPVSSIPPPALTVLNQFLTAQTAADAVTLGMLSQPGLKASTLTPKGLTRGYLTDVSLNGDGSVAAHARLVIDPTPQNHSVRYADEALTLTPSSDNSTFTVSGLTVSGLQVLSSGPHVLHTAGSRDATVFTVTFDSDLKAESVAPALSVVDGSNKAMPVTVHYDPNTRTVTVTVLGPPPVHASLLVATSLTDVTGTHLAQGYRYSLSG